MKKSVQEKNDEGTNNPINLIMSSQMEGLGMPFNKSGDVDKAIASALDYIESDDRYRFMLSYALSLHGMKDYPNEVENYYGDLAKACKTKESKDFVLRIACSVFCEKVYFVQNMGVNMLSTMIFITRPF